MGIMYKLMKHRNLTMDLNSKPTTKNKSDKCRLLATDGGHNNGTDVKDDGGDDNDDYTTTTTHHQRQKSEPDIEKRFTAEHILQLCKFLAEKSKRNKNLHKHQQSPKKLTKTQKTFQFQPMDYEDDNNDGDADADDSDTIDNMDDMIYDNVHDDNDNDDVVGIYQSQALPLLSHSKSRHNKYLEDTQQTMEVPSAATASTVLSSRLSPDINALNISSTALQQQNQQHYERLHHHNQQHQQQQHHLQHEQLLQQQQHHQHQSHQQGKRDILLKIRHQIFERKRLREKGYEPQAINVAVASQVWRPW